MTSNIGSRQLKDFGMGVGFNTSAKQSKNKEYAQSVIENALKKSFAPEFLNRVDDVVIFESLIKEDIFKIIDIELELLYGRIESLGYTVKLSKEAKEYIAEKGWDSAFGARPLKRAIQKYLEDPLAEEIIRSKVQEGDTIHVNFDKENEEIIVEAKKTEKSSKVSSD